MAAFVRIAGLIAAGNDRPGRDTACAQNCGVNFGSKHF